MVANLRSQAPAVAAAPRQLPTAAAVEVAAAVPMLPAQPAVSQVALELL